MRTLQSKGHQDVYVKVEPLSALNTTDVTPSEKPSSEIVECAAGASPRDSQIKHEPGEEVDVKKESAHSELQQNHEPQKCSVDVKEDHFLKTEPDCIPINPEAAEVKTEPDSETDNHNEAILESDLNVIKVENEEDWADVKLEPSEEEPKGSADQDGESVVSSQFFPCPDCSMSFTDYSYFERHLKWTHPAQYLARLKSKASKCESELSSMVTCSSNTGSSLTEKQQQAHVRHAHVRTSKPPKKRYPCPQCDSTFPFQATLRKHCQRWHGLETVWINDYLCCFKCRKHLTGGWGNGPHRCHDTDESEAEIQEGEGPGCVDRGFPFTGERTNICNGCGLGFKDLESLRKHSLIHSGERLYLCPLCGTVFGQLDSVNAHICIRTTEKRQEKPHQCGECGKCYETNSYLKTHQLSHTGEKPYRCEECGKSYRYNSQLTKHKRTHTGEKIYACTYCDRRYYYPGSLIQHKRSHTGERPYSCQECGKTYRAIPHLKAHIRSHTGERPYCCTQCPLTFARKHNLTSHIKNNH